MFRSTASLERRPGRQTARDRRVVQLLPWRDRDRLLGGGGDI
jgi:hypothetical protein